MPKRPGADAASPPGTVKKPRSREKILSNELAQDVAEYLERFAAGSKKRGGSGNHRPCRELIKQMTSIITSNAEPAAISSPKLHEVIVAYGVGRCFTATSCGLAKKGGPSAAVAPDELQKRRTFMLAHLEPVIEHLRCAWPDLVGLRRADAARAAAADTARAAAAVDALVCAIEEQFNRKMVSAASKLLNMCGLELPIYDSLARAALGLGNDVSYAAYLAAWAKSYAPLRSKYLEALDALLSDHDQAVTDVDLQVVQLDLMAGDVTKEWLCMRAHDVRLMRIGK